MSNEINTGIPQSARVYDYWLGGKDNFPADRALGDAIAEQVPTIRTMVRGQRAFLGRAVRWLAGEAGIRQFLDIGTGLPAADNTHEVAQRVAPESRIVYVDFDPLVLVHARALLTSSPEGVTDYVDADARDSDRVLGEARRTLDFSRPVGLIMSGILGHVPDDDEALAMVRAYLDALPSGSYFIALDGSRSEQHVTAEKIWNEQANPPYLLRSHAEFARFFDGLELVEPGVVSAPAWRPETPAENLDVVCGVGRKP